MLREDRARAGNTAFYGRNERPHHPFTASCFHGNLLFHRDLAILVGVEGNADVSEIKHTWVSEFARVRFSNQRSRMLAHIFSRKTCLHALFRAAL